MNELQSMRNNARDLSRRALSCPAASERGATLLELLMVMFIFTVVMVAFHQSFNLQVRMGVMQQYRQAEAEMELGIVTRIIERDLAMAGYALPKNIDPALRLGGLRVVAGVGGVDGGADAPDEMTLRGIAVGMRTRTAQKWSFKLVPDLGGNLVEWPDARERLSPGDFVIVKSSTTDVLRFSGPWLFRYNGAAAPLVTASNAPSDVLEDGDLVFGFYEDAAALPPVQPYNAVRYYLGGQSPATCAPGTQSLLRAEDMTTANPVCNPAVSDCAILNCVLDFELALGRDTDSDGIVDQWDNGAAAFTAAAVTADQDLAIDDTSDSFRILNKSLKQIRAYVLVQAGNRDLNYIYTNQDPTPGYLGTPTIRVGDLTLQGGAVGRDVTLTDEQRRYRWRVLTAAVTPRNIR